jgi:hypothetical protein
MEVLLSMPTQPMIAAARKSSRAGVAGLAGVGSAEQSLAAQTSN